MTTISTLDIEIVVMRYFEPRKNIIVPNITNMSGLTFFETDILVLTPSGYATGIEIKISKGDLKADLKKSQWKRMENPNDFNFWFKRFKYFYYAVPSHLAEAVLKQIPDWCGLIEVKASKDGKYRYLNAIRLPKELFKTKWTNEEKFQLARLGTLRIPNLKHSINEYIHKS